MPYLLRAINRENWPEPEDKASVYDLDADALNDLKTQDNTLSTWYADSEDELNTAMVAYLASMDRWVELECVEFVAIDIADIENDGISVIMEPNFTYIKDYQEKHRDLAKLRYDSIEKIANIVIKAIKNSKDYIIDRGKIRELFKEVVLEGKLKSTDIDKSRHRKLQRLVIELEKEIENQA